MIFNLYSLRDSLANIYLSPFPARSAVEAVRQVKGSLKDPKMASSPLVTNPSDFELWEIGQFDDVSGVLTTNLTLAMRVDKLVDPKPILGQSSAYALG